ncbi:MAG: bile acid:sodium symporter family protein [Isosphaeraceae bacterium]
MKTSTIITLLNVTALVAIMLSMGMKVTFESLLSSARHWRLLVLGIIANYVIVPAVTVGLLLLFQTSPAVSVGFLILAVCPGAPFAPLVTAIAKGNVPSAITLMVILAGLSAFLSPAVLSLLVSRLAPESDLHINPIALVKTLLITQMLPLSLGMAIHHATPRLALWTVKPVSVLANILLLALIGLILATRYESLAAIRFRGWMGMSLLLLASLWIGWLCGGSDTPIRKATAIATATRNVAVALAIVTSSFAGTPAVTAVVAYGLFSTLGALGCALLLGRLAGAKPGLR